MTKAPTLGDHARHAAEAVTSTVKPPRPHVSDTLAMVLESERALARMLTEVSKAHARDAGVSATTRTLATWTGNQIAALEPLAARYGRTSQVEPRRLARAISPGFRPTGFGMVRDLQDCFVMASEIRIGLALLRQAALALRDEEMKAVLTAVERQNRRQRIWLRTQIMEAAPQALIVPE